MTVYSRLLRLYPPDVRYAYGVEMAASFDAHVAAQRQRGVWPVVFTVIREAAALLIDVAAERISALYSHRSFHGRCEPDPGVVRPPNMGKAEWFAAADERDQRREAK